MSKLLRAGLLTGLVLTSTACVGSAADPQANTSAEKTPNTPAGRMAEDLAKSTGSRFKLLLQTYRVGKGAEFTEAIAVAIPRLSGVHQEQARQALVERLKRMKDTTLSEYLADELPEIRRAAAQSCAAKGSKSLIPRLIPLVRDTRNGVAEVAHEALKQLSGEDFGPKSNADREGRIQAARRWLDWWKKQQEK